MNKPDKSSTDDLKRMLRRLERIEAEKAERAQVRTNAPAVARDLASLAAGKRRPGLSPGGPPADPAQAVQRASASSIAVAPEFPRPVATPSEAARSDRQRVSAPVVAAAITAAIVSTIATVVVTVWLMGGLDRISFGKSPGTGGALIAGSDSGADSPDLAAAEPAAIEKAGPDTAATPPQPHETEEEAKSQTVSRFSGDARIAPEGAPSDASVAASPEYVLTPPSTPGTAAETVSKAPPAEPEAETTTGVGTEAADANEDASAETPSPVAALQAPQDPPPVSSQTHPSEPLSPASLKLVGPSSAVAEPGVPLTFPVSVGADASQLTGYYLVVSGLKRGARFSRGIELLFDTWQIPAKSLAGLELTVPSGFARRMKLNVELRGPLGDTITRTVLTVELPGEARRAVGFDGPDVGDDGLVTQDAQELIDKAEVFLDNGSLQGARLLLERAAGHGAGSAAMLLATSYDPKYAGHFSAESPDPDVAEAKRWYERAFELGVAVAGERLKSIGTP